MGSRARSCAEMYPRGIPAKPHWNALGRAAGPGCGEGLAGSTAPCCGQADGQVPALVGPVWGVRLARLCQAVSSCVVGVLSFTWPCAGLTRVSPLADVDECATGNGGCEGQCRNALGGFYCRCPPGHQLQGDGKTCQGRSLARPPASPLPLPGLGLSAPALADPWGRLLPTPGCSRRATRGPGW